MYLQVRVSLDEECILRLLLHFFDHFNFFSTLGTKHFDIHIMKHNYQTFVEDLSNKVKKNPKRFWYFFHERTKSKALSDIVTDSNSEYSATVAKTDLFNKYF